jgi:hypothetical protein
MRQQGVSLPAGRPAYRLYVLCNKNPRHKQRTKWARGLHAGSSSEGLQEAPAEAMAGAVETCGHEGAAHPHLGEQQQYTLQLPVPPLERAPTR